MIIFGFLALILFGALLLTLPVSTRDGLGASFEDALFTATSATCVTGLVVQDTYTYWSPFGQAVVLALIQIGGMGVVTMALAIFTITGRRIGLKQRVVMQETVSAPHVGGMVRLVGFIVRGTLLVEGAGAVVLALRFCPQFGFGKGLWFAVFHSVSAFCNAGFDLMGESGAFSSLVHYSADPLVNITIMALITIGGIGFFVWDDLLQNGLHFRRYRLQTKLVLVTSGLLIVLPAAYLYFVEFSHPQWAGLSAGERVLAALFQSVTTRTAGFNTIDQTALSGPALMLCTLTMLVGGSPGSTAGGFKTTSLAVLVLCVASVLRQRDSIQVFSRRFPPVVLRHTATLVTLYAGLFLAGAMAICEWDGVPLSAALYETASAIATVGLTVGITPGLGLASHLVLVFLMYFGRVGGLTLLYAVAGAHPAPHGTLPEEKVNVG
ncbi:MAG TPA: Trk family potassium uptake protein [Candidatus Ruthenibacterium merdipullorum]|nr:Trk family potassium uptake protein [Candidatus Ruthenibacterium merdipullorum]